MKKKQMQEIWWDENEYGRWCPSCGYLIKAHNPPGPGVEVKHAL